ncbi:Fc.00g099790.m01.CDS01 [Cosmosporella sp. VM-42]
MPRKDCQLAIPTTEALAKLNRARHDLIEPAFEAYSEGHCDYVESATLPTLELLASSEIHVDIDRDPESNEITSLHVSHANDDTAINFMGYHPEQDCVAFKGEARLFSDFIDFTSVLVKWESIEGAFGAAGEVRVPAEGLERGLNYDEFAARVEIVQYVMFAQSAIDADDNASDEEMETSLPRRSPTPRSLPPTPGMDFSLSDIWDSSHNKVYVEEEYPTGASMAGFRTPGGGSTSSLSPPPEDIKTPPSMQHLVLRPRVESESELSDTPAEAAKPTTAKKKKGTARTMKANKRRRV